MRRLVLGSLVAALSTLSVAAQAGATNPDISLIGQPFIRWTDDASEPSRRRLRSDAGVEEIYFKLQRGLPAGLTLKGGRYRTDFVKLHPKHHGQQHTTHGRPGGSLVTVDLSPAILHITARPETSRLFSMGG